MLNPIGPGKSTFKEPRQEQVDAQTSKVPSSSSGGHHEGELAGLKPRTLTRNYAIRRDVDYPRAESVGNQHTAPASGSRPSTSSDFPSALPSTSRPRSSMVTEGKQELLSKLQTIRQHFATLLAGNWSPGHMDDDIDLAMLPIMVAAENKRTPNLKLTVLPTGTGLVQWLENMPPPQPKWYEKAKPHHNERVMFAMPGFFAHKVVADVMQDSKGNVSVLVVEPLGFKKDFEKAMRNEALPTISKALQNSPLGKKISVTVLALDTMKSDNDCRIFGLSAASKMADQPKYFEALHAQNIKGRLKAANGGTAQVLAELGGIKIIEGKDVLPFGFVKHSQSETTLDHWREKNPSAAADAVNKKGQTLAVRYADHRTIRHEDPVTTQGRQRMVRGVQSKTSPVSTSIEKKRLEYIDRTMQYLANLPDTDVQEFIAPFDKAVRYRGVPEVIDPLYDKRKLGPDPATFPFQEDI